MKPCDKIYTFEYEGNKLEWRPFYGFTIVDGDAVDVAEYGYNLMPEGSGKTLVSHFRTMHISGHGIFFTEAPEWLSSDAKAFINRHLQAREAIDRTDPFCWAKPGVFIGEINGKETRAMVAPATRSVIPLAYDRAFLVDLFASSKRIRIGKRKILLDELTFLDGTPANFLRDNPQYHHVRLVVPSQVLLHKNNPVSQYVAESLRGPAK